jgi:hypothetical protein
LIDEKRAAMDNAYQEYLDATKVRDICLGVTAGIWFINIIDATAFTKKYKPVLQGKLGNDNIYIVKAGTGINSIGATFKINF